MKMSFGKLVVLFLCVIFISSGVSILTVYAAGGFKSYTVPNTNFQPGDTISSTEMNANFTYIENALNSIESTGGNSFSYTTEGSETISAGGYEGVDSPVCPAGTRPINVRCEASSSGLRLVQFGCYDTDCTCTYQNPTGSSATIYAKAICLNYLDLY